MQRDSRRDGESGIALIVVLLMLMLVGALMIGFTVVVIGDLRLRSVDKDRMESFYAAHGGLEKLTSDLGTLFLTSYAPTGAEVLAINANPPNLPGVAWVTTNEGPGYAVSFTAGAGGNPTSTSRSITTGPFAGFTGLVTTYVLSVTASTGNVGEVRLQRKTETVAIPLFQFGQFSETDIAFHPGTDFDFGGRIHTNGNLFLAAGDALTISDKVTAVGEVVRTHLPNGQPVSGGWTGTVRPITAPGSYRNLATTEGSLVTTLGSARNEPLWTNLSLGTYHGNIRNGRTGARRLDLPVVAVGYQPIDLIRRPVAGETVDSPVFDQRFFSLASLRILLSDTAADITNLPTVSGTAPIPVGTVEPYVVDATHPPFAEAAAGGNYRVPAGTPLLGGFIKIEMQTAVNVWTDVTLEILNLGIAGRQLSPGGCAEPNPDAVIRIERVADMAACVTAAQALVATNYWPKTLYDTREGIRRENEATTNLNVYPGGVMHYVELDVNNLRRWFLGQIGASGLNALATTGYTVYFSDRRDNRNAANLETAEYGFEDVVNPASASGAPNGALDAGEDVNGNGVLDTYGQTPVGAGVVWTAPLDATVRPWLPVGGVSAAIAQANPARFFRRSLKLVNGTLGNIISPGLTVAAENPVYVQGNYNANSAGFGNPHVACAVAADAVTLLSNNWSDQTSFTSPHSAAGRPATNTWYRFAVLAGKGRIFPYPSGAPWADFGSDGGTHNFLRFLESWAGRTAYYRGSLASMFYSRQAVGTYKYSGTNNTYAAPTRDYRFDVDFLTPALLAPRTPMFRDINTLGFTQILTPPR